MSPSVSGKQQRFMGAELGRKRAGQKTRTGMSEQQLKEMATMQKGMPKKMPPKGMPPKGMHKMPGGMMMKNKDMMMVGKAVPKAQKR